MPKQNSRLGFSLRNFQFVKSDRYHDSLSSNGINLFLERLGTHGRKLQRGRGRFDFYVEKITLVWQRDRRYDGSRGGCRDKVADREEGGTGEAAAETRSASTASTGKCKISYSLAHISGISYRFVDIIMSASQWAAILLQHCYVATL